MDPQIDRRLLARVAAQQKLSREAVDQALALSGLRPLMAERRMFALRAMKFAGVLSLAAGMIFLVAFNWQELGIYGRFAMAELPIVLALVVAWKKGTAGLSGKLAMMLAVLLTGALLALAGQTYQTGADVYELFLGWAFLTMPWTIACRYAPCWALWLVVMNTGVALYSGSAHLGLFTFLWPERWRWTPWALPFLFNLAAYVTVEALASRKGWGFSERWLRRGLMAIAMAFGTAVMVYQLLESKYAMAPAAGLEVFLFLGASVGFFVFAYTRRDDLFAFAVLALSWVVVTTTLVGRTMIDAHAGVGSLFLIALYVIGASSAAVIGISHIARQWKAAQTI